MSAAANPSEGNVEHGVGSLAGLKVVDLSRVLAGPYASQMLADHGAEVVKVEPPAGDMTREWGPPFVGGVSAYYAGLNRNKRHISLDLSRPDGRDVLDRLLADADILIENFKAGTMERWGIGPEVLAERHPRLIYCRITGFGTTGPMGGMPGYDAVVQAYSGIMGINGSVESGPLKVALPIVDLTTGMLALSGVLMALHERERSGLGQLVDVSLLDAAVSLLHPTAANYFMSGKEPVRLGNGHPNVAPYETFITGAGDALFVGGGNDRQFRALCVFLGAEDLADDPRFATNADRVAHRGALSTIIGELMEGVDLDAAAQSMLAHGVPASRVRSLPEVMTDPQVAHRQMVVDVDGFRVLGVPVKLERTPGAIVSAPRELGADTLEVLRDAGLSDEEIALLIENRVAVAATAPAVV